MRASSVFQTRRADLAQQTEKLKTRIKNKKALGAMLSAALQLHSAVFDPCWRVITGTGRGLVSCDVNVTAHSDVVLDVPELRVTQLKGRVLLRPLSRH